MTDSSMEVDDVAVNSAGGSTATGKQFHSIDSW